MSLITKFTNSSKKHILNNVTVNNFNKNIKDDVNTFTLIKIKRYHPYIPVTKEQRSTYSEIIDYCKMLFLNNNINNINFNNKITLEKFKELILTSVNNDNLTPLNILNFRIENFELKINNALLWISNIQEKIDTKPNSWDGRTKTYYQNRLDVYKNIIKSLENLLPYLIQIRDSKFPTKKECVGCTISGGKKI
jgi:hypothetical protein